MSPVEITFSGKEGNFKSRSIETVIFLYVKLIDQLNGFERVMDLIGSVDRHYSEGCQALCSQGDE